MEACGIIAEYNPLHRGHVYHLQKTKELTKLPIIVALSGSFMQRGQLACLDKFTRARLAVENGADLILELPTAFTLRSAQYFASGGVQLLKATGLVSTLACGVEHYQFPFEAAAQYMLQPVFQELLHQRIAAGTSYAVACAQLLAETPLVQTSGQTNLEEPNDILALEYTKALQGLDLKPLYIQRLGQGYNSTNLEKGYASASAIRTKLLNCSSSQAYRAALTAMASHLPESVDEALEGLLSQDKPQTFTNPLNTEQLLWQLLQYQLLQKGEAGLRQVTLVSEGLENLLLKHQAASSFAEAVSLCTGKRYPASRIRRLFCQLLLGLPKEYYMQETPAYLRVLAFNETGRQLLKAMKDRATLPLLTKIGSYPWEGQSISFRQQLELDFRATDCWALLNQGKLPLQSDYRISPYYSQRHI